MSSALGCSEGWVCAEVRYEVRWERASEGEMERREWMTTGGWDWRSGIVAVVVLDWRGDISSCGIFLCAI